MGKDVIHTTNNNIKPRRHGFIELKSFSRKQKWRPKVPISSRRRRKGRKIKIRRRKNFKMPEDNDNV